MTPTTPVLPIPVDHLVAAKSTELFSNDSGRAVYVEPEFGVLMKVAAPDGYFLVHGGNTVHDRHMAHPFLPGETAAP